MNIERRKNSRVDLDIDFMIFCLEADHAAVYLGKVEDVSAEGMQVSLQDDIAVERLTRGGRVVCERFPEALEVFGEDVPAEVIWIKNGRVGLRFLDTLGLTDEDIREAVSASGLPDWVDWPEEP